MTVPITIDDVRVRGVGKSFSSLGPSVFDEIASLQFVPVERVPTGESESKCTEVTSTYFEEGGRTDVPVFLLERLHAGDTLKGPAMILDGTQTVVVSPNATVFITSKHIVIELP